MKLIVGLGNPGKEYEKSRHNIGFMVVDYLQKNLDFEPFHTEKKFKAELSVGEFNGEKTIIAKPTTFMNLSGEAVLPLMQFYKLDPQDIFIVYDDLDLALGTLRIRKQGGAGTHTGMKSNVGMIGENFPRLRIGIESRGATSSEHQETSSFVLSQFSSEEIPHLKKILENATKACMVALEKGIEASMNKYNA